ncbi:hypothetical protein U9R90_20980 [Streptomyces sp. E11-3]|uniref:hypothetical protein n=1 Tax=Streptomyces sp. E11-3 TaxID=3110112 RepID=UPI0039818C79
MHRTTTTAALLVTVAASAVSGCVTVERPPGARTPSPTATPHSVPHARHGTEPREVQAPAREALEMIAPAQRASPDAPPTSAASKRPAPTEPAPRGRAARPDAEAPSNTPGSKVRPPRPSHAPDAPGRPDTPPGLDLSRGPVPGSEQSWAGLCALGERYGGWPADSPEARICRKAHGR